MSGSVPIHYTPQLTSLTQIPHSIIAGDFNAKNTAWYTDNIDDRRGTDIATQLNNMFILNNPQQHTHIPYQVGRRISSPDITFCSTSLSSSTSWKTVQQLSSDHLPIIISTESYAKANNPPTTYTNYKQANWTGFTEETELHFTTLNSTPIDNLNEHVAAFNNIILNADKHHIPKGNRRNYNPNFTTEINRLIKQRNDLKHKSPTPHTQDTTARIQALNLEITNKIQARKDERWQTFASSLDHTTNTSKLFKTIKNISNSKTCSTKTHAAITTNPQHTPSRKEQANILINYYASISHLKPTRTETEKRNSKHKRTVPLDHTSSPFTPSKVQKSIKKAKNTTSSGPDNICNLHLKHLGPQGVKALTNICNYSYSHCIIPTIWKRGKIITLLKPNKDPTQPSSYRPVTLLCTPSKILEHLILNLISPHIPLAQSQHGFRPLHSTSTLLTNLTQQISDGINSRKPQRTLLTTIDISKAFDAIPRYTLIYKIYNTDMANNAKRWLANYLAGRQGYVSFQNELSRIRNFPNGVPQGSVLSPTLFNLYMHNMPTPEPHTKTNMASYADDITITTTHRSADSACSLQQEYLNFLTQWLKDNRLNIAPAKSTTTLITSHTAEHRYRPTVTLNGELVPHKSDVKILGVTYDTGFTFRQHTQDIVKRCHPRLNALRALTGTDFGQLKTSATLLHKQFIRPVISYGSTAWSPNTSESNHKPLQVIQNNALRIATGCTNTTPINHLHQETKVLPIKNHLDMRGAQYYAAASIDTQHPCHYMAEPHSTPRQIKQSPHKYYQDLYNTIPPPPNPTTSDRRNIHTQITHRTIDQLGHNKLLQAPPPDILTSEETLSRTDQVHLNRLRVDHHPALLTYLHRFNLRGITDDTCPDCGAGPHNITHIMEHCNTHTTLRHRHHINGIRDLWDNPTGSIAYLRSTGLLNQTDQG